MTPTNDPFALAAAGWEPTSAERAADSTDRRRAAKQRAISSEAAAEARHAAFLRTTRREVLSAGVSETCACGEWALAEYGRHCPSC